MAIAGADQDASIGINEAMSLRAPGQIFAALLRVPMPPPTHTVLARD